ncbi:SDR family oxidoreductase [Pseudarthrobacter phenanthrenivorans]|uniref:SDR family oxidoreductase n=1 Tax=Pseudarthrobacter phenanthrenivorans TaxID=361575 RepID=A0A3B0F2F4_PSEPS|nr:SDR family oxidoreductase [Pseudarthrobacter phenanthrenivorans]RKO21126.1 SDR family oxidoreductase [Pseudarthrobacter phenanthrenivorans]TPV48814.1 SDR family oxidoreductase [Pseudarthrobacter phenanthrenivorans]
MSGGIVLVVGGTGMLGSQVVQELINRGKPVRALVRPGSDAAKLEAAGVGIARGDMLDPESLDRAMAGVDAVVTSAAGYTRHRKGDTSKTDTVGNSNLAEAAARAGVRRFVLTSILTCDQTPEVPHFWHKKLMEDRLEQLGVPFVALRPGAFLDQVTRFGGDPVTKGQVMWFGSPRIPLTFVLTPDLAGYLADAVDAAGVEGQRIDIGWDRPLGMQDFAAIAGRLTGRRIKVRSVPVAVLRAAGFVLKPVTPMAADLAAMIAWFQSGRYVADTTRQREVFGAPPVAEDAIRRLLAGLGHPVPG